MAGRDGAGPPGKDGPRAPPARRRKGGRLSDEDRDLWSRVTRKIAPMTLSERAQFAPLGDPPFAPLGDPPAAARPPAAAAGPTVAAPRAVALPPGFRLGGGGPAPMPPVRHDPAPGPAERLAAHPLRMDHKTHKQLTRGKLRPESRLDLHGMTLAAAKAELTGYLLSAHAAGRRLVLVITGKGKGDHGPLPTRSGALRHEVPHWLHMAPLAGVVLQVVPAHLRHGGGGAYYVYLRRRV
ncbi:Smr/MutS family protein [Paracoccus luteus]|uniref:Smr/MutS family protein n=1 Tax=Paracoccus luteus TaxID=2508543 RepID=UPI00143187D0|nr:Smr/MutS family protein [Paracoccus luteus]